MQMCPLRDVPMVPKEDQTNDRFCPRIVGTERWAPRYGGTPPYRRRRTVNPLQRPLQRLESEVRRRSINVMTTKMRDDASRASISRIVGATPGVAAGPIEHGANGTYTMCSLEPFPRPVVNLFGRVRLRCKKFSIASARYSSSSVTPDDFTKHHEQ